MKEYESEVCCPENQNLIEELLDFNWNGSWIDLQVRLTLRDQLGSGSVLRKMNDVELLSSTADYSKKKHPL